MENEELAALRATLAAADRLARPARARAARVGARLGDERAVILPYVLASSCSDPRDRVIRVDRAELEILHGGLDSLPPHLSPITDVHEPAPIRPAWVVALVLGVALMWIAVHVVTLWLWVR